MTYDGTTFEGSQFEHIENAKCKCKCKCISNLQTTTPRMEVFVSKFVQFLVKAGHKKSEVVVEEE